MKLEFTAKDGRALTVEGADADLLLAEIKHGTDDFVMLRFKPGTLTVNVPADNQTWYLPGS